MFTTLILFQPKLLYYVIINSISKNQNTRPLVQRYLHFGNINILETLHNLLSTYLQYKPKMYTIGIQKHNLTQKGTK